MIMIIYGIVKMFIWMIVYCGIGGFVLIVCYYNCKKWCNEMDEGIKWIMCNIFKDENGKYLWEK